MENKHFKPIVAIALAIAVISGSVFLSLYISATRVSVESLRENGFYVYDEPLAINDFSLVADDETPFTNEAFQDKWTLVFFGYTFCPDICPITLATIRQFHDLLRQSGQAEDVQVVMISVDPMRDTPQVLSDYVSYFDPEFIGVTGDYARIYTVARQMNVAFSYQQLDDDNYLVSHNGEIMLINPAGSNVGFFKPPYDPLNMVENFQDVRKILR